jgi:hypothetical protein
VLGQPYQRKQQCELEPLAETQDKGDGNRHRQRIDFSKTIFPKTPLTVHKFMFPNKTLDIRIVRDVHFQQLDHSELSDKQSFRARKFRFWREGTCDQNTNVNFWPIQGQHTSHISNVLIDHVTMTPHTDLTTRTFAKHLLQPPYNPSRICHLVIYCTHPIPQDIRWNLTHEKTIRNSKLGRKARSTDRYFALQSGLTGGANNETGQLGKNIRKNNRRTVNVITNKDLFIEKPATKGSES